MDRISQEGLGEMLTTSAEETPGGGGEGKTEGGWSVAETIKNIPCPETWQAEHSHMFNPRVFIQVKKRTKRPPIFRMQITPKCVHTCHKE